MAVAVTKALESGFRASSVRPRAIRPPRPRRIGARAGLRAAVVHPEGAVAVAKLAQARAAGADVIAVPGSFADAFAAADELAGREGYAVVNSVDPDRIEGQKTAALEIVEEIGVPDAVALPYGGGGNTVAYRLGFEFAGRGVPTALSVEAARRADTAASAIRITRPVHAEEVAAAVELSGGTVFSVEEEELAAAWRALAREEGVFCEPASPHPSPRCRGSACLPAHESCAS